MMLTRNDPTAEIAQPPKTKPELLSATVAGSAAEGARTSADASLVTPVTRSLEPEVPAVLRLPCPRLSMPAVLDTPQTLTWPVTWPTFLPRSEHRFPKLQELPCPAMSDGLDGRTNEPWRRLPPGRNRQ